MKAQSTRARLVILAAAAVAGCVPAAPAASGPPSSPVIAEPAGSPVLGIDWGHAPSVQRPENFAEDPNSSSYTGTHPILRIPGQATMTDVTRAPGGGFVAVGYVPPSWVPVAWTSPDGDDWSIHAMGETEFTFPVSVASGPDGTLVAVGRSGQLPVAWTSTDGFTWQRHDVPLPQGSDVAERMTSVVATERGFLAGGSVGPELFERDARFWTSTDGTDWHAVADDPVGFANAEVRAITAFGEGFVAVGVVGSAQEPSAAVAWTSPDGLTWNRVDDPAFADGVAVAAVEAPFGGLVAVGSDVERREAVVWISEDGRRWTKSPTEGSRQYAGFVWMTDVVAIGDDLIAIGVFQGLQRGTATSWVSRDGVHWERAHTAPVQEQGEFYAITPGGPGAIVVGSFGAPDSYVPTVWLSPAR